ncbi:Muscle-specific protein 20-like isoform X2 [Oopsacas minuta]|uniref:Muscle-specific protein 20-like isoform X2 n=1 Tax=Oopsacas minuta TaxID=111878 RepID=A0AAV7JVQ3_9METZ|nr:Muscle-specific protein 20-like isoform X2 [Oopsacas minuta]
MAHRAEKSGIAADLQQTRSAKYPSEAEKESIKWMESILNEKKRGTFQEWLKDGSTLCRLINKIYPSTVSQDHCKPTASGLVFKQYDNINHFLKGCKEHGVSEKDLFVTLDLHEGNDMAQVIATLYALDRKAQKSGRRLPVLSPKEAEGKVRDFSKQQIADSSKVISLQMGTNAGASQAGMVSPGTRRQIK